MTPSEEQREKLRWFLTAEAEERHPTMGGLGDDGVPDPAAPSGRRRIGRYRLIEMIGEGGMGVVFRAVDDELGREVALKMLKTAQVYSATQMERFQREARNTARLSHPGIARLYEIGHDADAVYLSLELISGKPLDPRAGDLHVRVALLEKVARAVQYGVYRLVVHRFEGVRDGCRIRVAPAHAKVVDVIHGNRTLRSSENSWQSRAECDRPKSRFILGSWQGMQRSIEPSIRRGFQSGSAGLHEILRIKVRARWIGGAGRVHNGQVPLVPDGLQRGQRGMQSEEPVQVEDVVARNVDAGTHRVISALAMRHDNVQAIRSPALKNYDQPLGARAKFDRPKRSTCQKAWHSGRAHNCQSAIANEYATSDGHGTVPGFRSSS